MQTYLAPNDTHQYTVPIVVGSEYAVPTEDAKIVVRVDGVDVKSTVPKDDSTELSFEVSTPAVAAGEIKLVSVMATVKTSNGLFRFRDTAGVVDLMDIPANADDVRKELGLTANDVSDEYIDYVQSYLKYYTALKPEFHVARQTNQYLTKRFGDLIAITAALDLAPSLIILIDKKRATENGDVTRFGDAKNLQDLIDSLRDKLAELLDELAEYIDQVQVALTPVFQFIPMYQPSIGQ